MMNPMNTEFRISGRLAHMGALRFAGPDAGSFLQGQISNDTKRLASGSPLLAAYSSAQGRVVALFHLLPHSTGILGLLPREIVLPTVQRLRKFVMRAKLTIEDVSDQFSVMGVHGAATLVAAGFPVPDETLGYAEHHGIGVARVGRVPASGMSTAAASRYWVVGPHADLARHAPAGDAHGSTEATDPRIEQDWRLADIRAGLPQVYTATREMFVAQMLNLDLLDGISFTKGCFTGQEIIARTQHLGRIKRRLFRLRLPAGTWALGQAIHLSDGRSGRLTELVPLDEGVEALAVLNLEGGSVETAPPAAAHPALGDTPPTPVIQATELPLPYSLAGSGSVS